MIVDRPKSADRREQADEPGSAGAPPQRTGSGILADRIAAALVHREPGWRLPRRSALARRYSVSVAEIDAAIGELVQRSLIRRLPDGQLYRASAAEYLIQVEGVAGLSTRLDPMGSEITCASRHVSQREAPQDVAWSLGLGAQPAVRTVRCVWTADSVPAAISTTYMPDIPALSADADADADAGSFETMLYALPRRADGAPGLGYARAVDLELSPPQPSAARSLRLLPGQPAISVTIRFDDPQTRTPAGLTVVILKPELFRVIVETG